MSKTRTFVALSILSIFLFGCASLSVEKMVPDNNKMNFKKHDKTIKIGVVTVNNEEGIERMDDFLLFGDNIKLDNQILKEAITAMIEQSQLFKTVVLEGTADYEINANIDLQGQRALYSGTIESLIKISYELVDVGFNESVWKNGFKTTGSCTIQEAYPAVTRTNTAVERAVKKNLLKCINEISKQMNH